MVKLDISRSTMGMSIFISKNDKYKMDEYGTIVILGIGPDQDSMSEIKYKYVRKKIKNNWDWN